MPPAGSPGSTPPDDGTARTALHEVCASSGMGRADTRPAPHATTDALFAASDAAMAGLTAADLAEAMAGHPPIGRPKPGDPTRAREQSGMAGASDALKAEMLEPTWPTRRSSGMSS